MAEFEENNDFDQLRNLLEGAEIAPSRDLWPDIESKLNDKPKRPFFLWFTLAGLLLGVTLIGSYLIFTDSLNSKLISIKNNDVNVQNASALSQNSAEKNDFVLPNKSIKSTLLSDISKNELLKTDNNSTEINGEKEIQNITNNTAVDNQLNVEKLEKNNSVSSKTDANSETNKGDKAFKSTQLPSNNDLNPIVKKRSNVNQLLNSELIINESLVKKSADKKIDFNTKLESTQLKLKEENNSLNTNRNVTKNSSLKVLNQELKVAQSNTQYLQEQADVNYNIDQPNNIASPKLSLLMVKSKPLLSDSLRFKNMEVKVDSRKTNIFNAQKSYDIISSVNYFYNNDYKPESNLLINNSYKYGIQVNYYVNKNWGLGFGIVQNTIFYNSVLLEKQTQTSKITSIKEVKLPDSSYTLQLKDSSVAKIKEVANFKSLQIKSVNIPLQLLFKFKINNKFSVENRVGVVTSFASSQSRKITRPVGFSYQHNLNLLYSLTPKIQLLFGPEYSFYITDLVQNKSGWYPLGLHIGARINLK